MELKEDKSPKTTICLSSIALSSGTLLQKAIQARSDFDKEQTLCDNLSCTR